MTKKRGKYENKLFIDMPFDEALERFALVKPLELDANLQKAKKKKPPGRKSQPDDSPDSQTVVSLRDRRKANDR